MELDGRKRVVIENIKPCVDNGAFPIKRVVGEKINIEADVFTDGHDEIAATLVYKHISAEAWLETPMHHSGNDRWQGTFTVETTGTYLYSVWGWIDHFRTWLIGIQKKMKAGQDITNLLPAGISFLEEASRRVSGAEQKKITRHITDLKKTRETAIIVSILANEELGVLMKQSVDRGLATLYKKEFAVTVETQKASFSTWYELFPRSYGDDPGRHGTFKACEKLLPKIAKMGFDVLYLPPVHPIGKTNRKGKNNSAVAGPDDPGSPWAIGSDEGGHKSVNPLLGSMKDFEGFIAGARKHGIDVALDLTFQCSMDHPYIKEHPEWFLWLPDGTIQYAENPPKQYQDVVPFNFETERWQELWEELKSIVLFWIGKGVTIFRVDNPHTKPVIFWDWLIREIKNEHPDVIFLAEAFTRPRVKYRLAKGGFSQSYTYFTWRNTKHEIAAYLNELTKTDVKEFFRPNFWPNTPDILPEYLQYSGRPGFIIRLILAATLSSNYGVYGAAFELLDNKALEGTEEYKNSEKYEIKNWDTGMSANLCDLISRINRIRRENPALQTTGNITFYESDNDHLLFFGKATEDLSNVILVVVNLDPFHTQAGSVRMPLDELGITAGQSYLLLDLLGDEKFIWQGEWNRVELNPEVVPAQIFVVRRRMRREHDFDYFL